MAKTELHDFHKTNGLDHSFKTDGPSLTRQEFADECDINTLMAKYETHVSGGPGNLNMMGDPDKMFYGDFTALPSSLMEFHSFMDMAHTQFMRLPAKVRKEFDNDPVQFVEFAGDPENMDQMREWGLAKPLPVEPPPVKVVIDEPAAAPSAASAAPGAAERPGPGSGASRGPNRPAGS